MSIKITHSAARQEAAADSVAVRGALSRSVFVRGKEGR